MAHSGIDIRHLRSALEYAVLMAREGQKFKPPLAVPPGIKRFTTMGRIPTRSLPALRKLIDGDPTFRARIAAGAIPELVDPIGRVWLHRESGWEEEIVELVARAEAEAADADAERQLRRADRRRRAAEEAAARAQAEIVALRASLEQRDRRVDELGADLAKLADELDGVMSELLDTRLEVRHARDRERAAVARRDAAEEARRRAERDRTEAEAVRDDVLVARAEVTAERAELARLASLAETLSAGVAALVSDDVPSDGHGGTAGRGGVERVPLAMPGGVAGDSLAAADHLWRSGAAILVDGYNVAKLGWPGLVLAAQRDVLLDAVEDLVRRHGADVTVVFDGADVVGASADRRRVIRVVYSPDGVSADDVIRDEVGRLPARRRVVVVTNDQAIRRDVRARGANTLASDQLLALIR